MRTDRKRMAMLRGLWPFDIKRLIVFAIVFASASGVSAVQKETSGSFVARYGIIFFGKRGLIRAAKAAAD